MERQVDRDVVGPEKLAVLGGAEGSQPCRSAVWGAGLRNVPPVARQPHQSGDQVLGERVGGQQLAPLGQRPGAPGAHGLVQPARLDVQTSRTAIAARRTVAALSTTRAASSREQAAAACGWSPRRLTRTALACADGAASTINVGMLFGDRPGVRGRCRERAGGNLSTVGDQAAVKARQAVLRAVGPGGDPGLLGEPGKEYDGGDLLGGRARRPQQGRDRRRAPALGHRRPGAGVPVARGRHVADGGMQVGEDGAQRQQGTLDEPAGYGIGHGALLVSHRPPGLTGRPS